MIRIQPSFLYVWRLCGTWQNKKSSPDRPGCHIKIKKEQKIFHSDRAKTKNVQGYLKIMSVEFNRKGRKPEMLHKI